MNFRTDNFKKPLLVLLLVLMVLVAGRGLFSSKPLAGHDVPAYPVNQVQFMENLRDGVLFPRWSADTRYGYGQPRLQFRPPLLHYLASPVHAVTGNPFLALHIALIGVLFMAAWGAFALARLRVGEWAALVAAAGFVCANYLLANLYLRGAYYEVTASAAMPWILWAQSRENFSCRRARLVGPLAWAALLMAHPAVSFFFFPLAVAHALSESRLLASAELAFGEASLKAGPLAKPGAARPVRACCWNILLFSFVFFGLGALLAAPYTWVMLAERPWVRMEIFLSNLESWRRHFFSLREWFTECWPAAYMEYRGFDYLQRALRPEMRGLNIWAATVIFLSPFVWWLTLRRWRRDKALDKMCASSETSFSVCHSHEKLFFAIFFYAATWISLALSLRLSLPVWNHVPMMDTFNYPWRVLNVTSLCLALAAAYGVALVSEMMKKRGYRLAGMIIIALFILAPLAEAIPHTKSEAGQAWLTRDELTSSAIRRHPGILQQFYTPTWVQRYATEPAQTDAQVVEGSATVTVTGRRPTRWSLRVEASTPARIALSHYYYPGWRIHGADGAIIKPEPWGERALISFVVPAGTHNLEARFGSTPARRAANGGFVAGLAFMLLGILWPRRTHLPRRIPLQGGDHNTAPAIFSRSPPSEGWLKAGVGAVILLVGAIILADYLARERDDEIRAIKAGQQLAKGDNLSAIHSFARLLRERETDIAARYNLGAAYHNYGWHDEALASYNEVMGLADEYAARAAHSAARISLMRGDFARARLYYEAALRHRPGAKDIRAEYEQIIAVSRDKIRNPNSEARNKFSTSGGSSYGEK